MILYQTQFKTIKSLKMIKKLNLKSILQLVDDITTIENFDIQVKSINNIVENNNYNDFEKKSIDNAINNKKLQL